jgi:hypothetical protein
MARPLSETSVRCAWHFRAFFAGVVCLLPVAATTSAGTTAVPLSIDSGTCGRIVPSPEWALVGRVKSANEVQIKFRPRRGIPLTIAVKCMASAPPADVAASAGLITDDSGNYYMRNFGFYELSALWNQPAVPSPFAKALGEDVVMLRPDVIRGNDWFFVVECGTECFLSATLYAKTADSRQLRAEVAWPRTKTFDRAARLKPTLQQFVARHLVVDAATH